MNQILDKLGIYDLVAVLLSGVCMVTFSVIADRLCFQCKLWGSLEINETLLFLVVSYFMGLIFQEMGSLIQKKVFNRNNRLLMNALDSTKASNHQYLTTKEKDGVFQIVKTKLALENTPDISLIYNYCKYYLIANGEMVRADKNQSIAGLSRSLSLYFFVLFVGVCCKAIAEQSIMWFKCAIGILLLSIMLGFRSVRFIKMRYIDIIRTFYYKYIQTTEQIDKSH